MGVVLDASLMARALIPSQRLAAAKRCLDDAVEGDTIVAPANMRLEFTSTVRRQERIGSLTEAEGTAVLDQFQLLPLDYRWDDDWLAEALRISRICGFSSIYDSLYLACAARYGFVLATCDARFVRGLGAMSRTWRDLVELIE